MPRNLDLQFVHIPGGEFIIGSSHARDPKSSDDEKPQHLLSVSEYHIMRNPVTNEQFLGFVQETGQRAPLFWKDGEFPKDQGNHPVVGVSFLDAIAFCRWAREATGLPVRLPSEPEWEKASRGTDGRLYPWGDKWEEGRSNSYEAGIGRTSPVDLFSPEGDSPFGVSGMAGNVQQWTASLFGGYPYDPTDGREVYVYDIDSPALLPKFHESGGTMNVSSREAATGKTVIRGGSWREDRLSSRCAYRSWAAPMHRSDDTGFRCCYEP